MENNDITQAIMNWQNGTEGSQENFYIIIYEHLRQLASKTKNKMAQKEYESNNHLEDHINSTTALVHEIYLKLQNGTSEIYGSRKEFFVMVSKSIHNILVDQCRKSLTAKRTADITSIHNYKDVLIIDNNDKDQRLLDLSSCIDKLKVDFPRQGEAVILKYFGGLLTKEIAETLNISFSSAEKDIAFAKTWMKTRLMA